MTISGMVKAVVPAGSAFLAQQVIEPFNPNIFERLGTVGIVAVGSYYLVKYFMGQIDKKDARNETLQQAHVDAIKQMHAEQVATNAVHTTMLVDELRESRSGRERLSETLSALTRSNEAMTREITNARASRS